MLLENNPPKHHCVIWLLVLLLLATACTSTDTPIPQEPLTPTETPVPLIEQPSVQEVPDSTVPAQQPETAPSIEPSPTSPPAVLPTLAHKVCDPGTDTIDAAFIGDIGLADGTHLPPNAAFRKIWQVRNTGDCTWPDGTELVRIAGDLLPGPQQLPVSQTSPERDITLSVELTAPARPGTYKNFWRLRTSDGHLFGAVLFVEIIVAEGAPTPSLRPMATGTLWPTATAALATPTSQSTQVPSPTAPATTTPTAMPPKSTDSACPAIDDRFHSVINQATSLGIQVLCATGPTDTVSGQIQLFRQNVEQSDPHLHFQSFMILRNDTDKIYVLEGKDVNTYQATVTTYSSTRGIPSDQAPATCIGLPVPSGYMLPTGRIGATWCNKNLWIATTGWPWDLARDATLEIQETTNGLLIRATTDATGVQAAQVYLIAIDFDKRRATVD